MKSLTQLNQYSAQSVAYDDQGTGAQTLADRYQINGLIDTAEPVMKNIEKICSAAGSWLSYDIHEGKWGVVINSTGTSVASFSDANILSNISVSGTGLNELYNAVKVEFPHRDLRDSADFVTIEIPASNRNANEEDNTLNLSYDIINEPIQAQLLGFIELKQSRIDLIINFETDYSNINVKAGDIIDVTNSRFNFNKKLFRVISTSESQDADGAIRIAITALEYDSSVYSTDDLFRYTRTDENGIISIGSIGVPGTPQVTKFERDARPRIIVEATAPTGVVEALEFWLTEDTNIAQDSLRSYKLIASIKPVGGGVFTSGASVTFDYDNLTNSDFFIKVRGVNSLTTGPFSNVSGLVQFNPQQVTDAIGPQTGVVDATGALLTGIAANLLIKQVGDLFAGSVSTGSIFGKVFELFKDVTGVDLVGQASSGTLVVAGSLGVQDEGIQLTTSTQTINFVGNMVTATNVGGVVEVLIGERPNSGGMSISTVTPNTGPTVGGTTVTITGSGFSGANGVRFGNTSATSFTVQSNTVISATSPANNTGTVGVTVTKSTGTITRPNSFTYFGSTGYLTIADTYPPDRSIYQDPVTGLTSDTAPITGPYYIRYSGPSFYGALTKGSGNVKLYKSDGTLVETLAASSLTINGDLVALPFADREYGTDYYILMDQGVIRYCDWYSPPIALGGRWNFNTPLYDPDPYDIQANQPGTPPTYSLFASSVTPNGTQTNFGTILTITWSAPARQGSGNIYIKDFNTDSTQLTFTAAQLFAGNTRLENLTGGTKYYVTADAGVAISTQADCYSNGNSAEITKSDGFTFTMVDQFVLVTFEVDDEPIGSGKINPQTNVVLVFNRAAQFGTLGTISIFESNGTLHQEFDVATTFENDYTSEIIWIGTGANSNKLYLNPTKDFKLGTTYYVNGTAGSVKDFTGQSWQGLNDTTTVAFSIDPGPTASIPNVDDNSPGVVMNFDRPVALSTGTVEVYDGNGVLVATIPANDPSITLT